MHDDEYHSEDDRAGATSGSGRDRVVNSHRTRGMRITMGFYIALAE